MSSLLAVRMDLASDSPGKSPAGRRVAELPRGRNRFSGSGIIQTPQRPRHRAAPQGAGTERPLGQAGGCRGRQRHDFSWKRD